MYMHIAHGQNTHRWVSILFSVTSSMLEEFQYKIPSSSHNPSQYQYNYVHLIAFYDNAFNSAFHL